MMAVMIIPKMKRITRTKRDLFFFPFLPDGCFAGMAAGCDVCLGSATGSSHSLNVNSPLRSGASTVTVESAEVLAETVATALPQTGQNLAPSGKEAPQWVQYAIGIELFSVGTVLADEVEDEVEILVGDIDLITFQALVDLYEVLPAAGLDAPDFVEHRDRSVAGGGQSPGTGRGRTFREYSHKGRENPDFTRAFVLDGNLLVDEAFLVHGEIHDILASVHPDHDQVRDQDDHEKHNHDDEPDFNEAVPDFLPVIVGGGRNERDQQWNTEQNTENLEEDI